MQLENEEDELELDTEKLHNGSSVFLAAIVAVSLCAVKSMPISFLNRLNVREREKRD
ncbi:MAG: hypothetical protein A4E49_01600 [Methanosaeta sp. PtaU1.Bin112]|nr:MAG: hypothetical protein A4E49_01600 [Methanosaeta sp. PtaU1.Bin112]